MSIVPRVMERIWNTILDQGENRATWEQLARLDETKSEKNALSAAEEERFAELRSKLKAAVMSRLGRADQICCLRRRGDAAAHHALL